MWIADFASTYRTLTSRWPVIYTSRDWWNACTGPVTGDHDVFNGSSARLRNLATGS